MRATKHINNKTIRGTNNMKQLTLVFITILLTACGNSPADTAGPPLKAVCELSESSVRVMLAKGNEDQETVTADAYSCAKGDKLHVEFRHNENVYLYPFLESWTSGQELPEYLDPNISCGDATTCSLK